MIDFYNKNGGNVTAQDCYRAIIQDVDAHALFHHNHMADHTRISHPWDNIKSGNVPDFSNNTSVATACISHNR